MAGKSTNVRMREAAIRPIFAALERLAPALSGALATRIWFTLPSAPPRAPRPVTPGTPFEVTALGRTVRGTAWGSPDAPLVALVHGWGGTAAQMQGWVDPLVAAGLRVVAHDGLSHGESDPGPSGARSATATELAAALQAVVDAHGRPQGIVAHSFGALVAGVALRAGATTTDRLVLVAPMTDPEPYARAFVTMLGAGDRTYRRLATAVHRRVGISLADISITAMPAEVPSTRLLVAHDRGDRQTPLAGARHLTSGWPGARLIVTDGLGHHRILRDAHVIADGVAFLAQPAVTTRARTA